MRIILRILRNKLGAKIFEPENIMKILAKTWFFQSLVNINIIIWKKEVNLTKFYFGFVIIEYNTSPYHLKKNNHQESNNSTRLHTYLSSSAFLSSSSIDSIIKPTTFHDYTFSIDHYPPSEPKPISSPTLQSFSPLTLRLRPRWP